MCGVALHHGRVVRTGAVGRLQRMAQLTLGKRIAISSVGLAAVGLVIGEYAAAHGTLAHVGAGAVLLVLATLVSAYRRKLSMALF